MDPCTGRSLSYPDASLRAYHSALTTRSNHRGRCSSSSPNASASDSSSKLGPLSGWNWSSNSLRHSDGDGMSNGASSMEVICQRYTVQIPRSVPSATTLWILSAKDLLCSNDSAIPAAMSGDLRCIILRCASVSSGISVPSPSRSKGKRGCISGISIPMFPVTAVSVSSGWATSFDYRCRT